MKWEPMLWLLIFLLLCLGLGFLWFWWRRLPAPPPEGLLPPEELQLEPVRLLFSEPIPFRLNQPDVAQQDPLWQAAMQEAGNIFRANRVSAVLFLHGTFTGSDPLDILPSLRKHLPRLHSRLESPMQNTMRRAIDLLTKDNGNFLPEYIALFAKATGLEGRCHHFAWSSANHHMARLRGALQLIDRLSSWPQLAPEQRVLLIGHSHARQVFALFTHLIALSDLGRHLWAFALREGLASPIEETNARRLNAVRFDFVTLGGPVRYNWAFLPEMRALHIVNHRGQSLRFERHRGFWRTESGDYIQQWGTVGSDALANSPRERSGNRELDQLLGKGLDTRVWLRTLSQRQRLGNFGRTLLVDYGDSTKIAPNFVASVFGHGVYTRYRAMLFNTCQICRFLYQKDPLEKKEWLEGSLS